MTKDERMAALLTECLADLGSAAPGSEGRAREALRSIEQIAPGEIEAMAARLQLHRLKRTTAH